jgi:hypothetical protein
MVGETAHLRGYSMTLLRAALATSIISLGFGVAMAELPAGWEPAGRAPGDYDFSRDASTSQSGHYSALIEPKPGVTPAGFGTLMQTIDADKYRGKRVRFSGYLKTSNATRAQLWMRIDGPSKQLLALDNMDDRPVIGTTDWKRYDIVLDVPWNSADIAFGFLLEAPGKVWGDSFKLEKVDESVPVTAGTRNESAQRKDLENGDFEK